VIALSKRIPAILAAGIFLSSCATSRIHREGLDAIEHGRYEEGLGRLQEAARQDPSNFEYRIELKARHDDAVVKLLGEADKARGAGNPDEAEQTYRRVLVIEPGNERAQRGLDLVAGDRRHATMTAKALEQLKAGDLDHAGNTVRAILAEDPGFSPATAVQSKIDTARGPISVTPRLKTRENRPVTLQFRDANTKMVFEVLSRQTGVNFVFDKDVKSDGKTTIFVQQVPVDQAIELVIGQNQLARQVLSDNMVLIYPNTPAKQKEYQDEIVKTFFLTNADPKKAQELLKTVLNAKTLFIDDKASLVVIRDTPETVRMAEKLIASLDLAESEVMMEVEVLEITRSNLQQLGIEYPTSTTVASPTKLTLDTVRHLGRSDFSLTGASLTADYLKQVGRANTLASPRIRARNHEKAKILIGQREPVITNSVIATANQPITSSSVQYLDVGLTLEVEPTVHLDNEVSIKMNLEVSSIIKQVTNPVSGSIAYEIGTRNAQTLLTLKDGETQILAGLIQDSDTRNSSHITGLGDIPILGRLFGSDHTTKDKSEIVLSITPRVIRSATRPSSETTEFWYGTEMNLRSAPLGSQASSGPAAPDTAAAAAYAPLPQQVIVAPTTLVAPPVSGIAIDAMGSSQAVQVPATPVPTPSVISAPPVPTASVATAPPVPTASVATPPAVPTPSVSPPVDAPVPRARPQSESNPDGPNLTWAAPSETAVGQSFDVTVALSSEQPLSRISSQLHFDGSLLQLDGADAGDLIPSGLQSAATPKINQRAGVVQYVVTGSKDSTVQGEGNFLVLHFKALNPSTSTPITLQFSGVGADGRNIRAGVPAPLAITIK
jgi:general secretion pathway protein D